MSDTEYTSIRVKQSTKEKAAEGKGDRETWDDFILRCSEEPTLVMTEHDVIGIIDKRINQRVIEEARL